MVQTGFRLGGRPSMGAWVSYGIGCETEDLPAFCRDDLRTRGGGQPLYDRLWGAGFLPSQYQGVKFRSVGDPGAVPVESRRASPRTDRRQFLDSLGELNRMTAAEFGDPETNARIAQYEMAFRMQTSVPELTDISKEPANTFELYGEDARKPGTFAANCLLARRLAERGVRFIQLYHRDWDHHGDLPADLPKRCKDVDQASAALIPDLKQRGMLDDTLVVWGGEFGRTVYCQGRLTATDYGRDHHGRCFTMWMAGGGIKPGVTVGETDDYCYNITQRPGPRARSAGDHSALPGHRSPAADVQVPGPRLPPDGRRRASGEGDSEGVTATSTQCSQADPRGGLRGFVAQAEHRGGRAVRVKRSGEARNAVSVKAPTPGTRRPKLWRPRSPWTAS